MKKGKLYLNEDGTKYAVLVSYGYGAGWSTWTEPWFAYDKRIVEFWLEHKDDEEWMNTVEQYECSYRPESIAHKEAREFFCNTFNLDTCPYFGGFKDIELEWVEFGKQWHMDEYDGVESIKYVEDYNWNCFITSVVEDNDED